MGSDAKMMCRTKRCEGDKDLYWIKARSLRIEMEEEGSGRQDKASWKLDRAVRSQFNPRVESKRVWRRCKGVFEEMNRLNRDTKVRPSKR